MINKEKVDLICSCLDRAIQENSDRLPLETQRGTNINLVKRENGNYKVVFNTEKETYEAITKENLYKFLFEDWRGNETLGREDGRITLFEAIHQYIQSHCDLTIPLEKQSVARLIPLNQILYGPPGTGKTYNTVTKALEIIDGTVPSDRKEAKDKFEEYRKSGQIEFVTFHQSYGYEEFVEGIRADLKSEEIAYKLERGIFQKLSNKAKENFENSKKTIQQLAQEKTQKQKLEIFLNDSFENETEFSKTKGGKFKIKELMQDKIILFTEDSNYSDKTVVLKIDEFLEILKSDSKFKSSKQMAKEIFGVNNQRQQDTYYLSMYDEYLKMQFDDIEEIKSDEPLKNYILIIDEINRGNISKIFGELITLIEPSKRIGADEAIKLKLPYSNEEFGVPQNLYIIGTMNTADRSIALMDTALRRRFHFEEMMPDLDVLEDKNIDGIDLKKLLSKINQRVEYLYDRDHTIGHAYFIEVKKKEDLDDVMRNKIFPLLQEYFYDDWEKIRMVLGDGFIDKIEVKSDIFDYKPDEYLEDEKFIYTIKESFDYTKLQS